MVQDFILAGEEAVGNPSPTGEHVRATGLQPRVGRRRLVILDDPVLVPGQVASERKESLAAQLLVILHIEVDTLVVHDTQVRIRHLDETAVIGNGGTLQEDTRTVLLEEFHAQGKVVLEELEVKTQVLLQGSGPAHVGAVFGVGPAFLVAVGRTEVDTVGAAHLVLIHEATSRGRVGTDKADGVTDLEEGPDILEGLLPEGFIGNGPADTRCREETEAVVGVEVLGTVVTGVQFGEVTVVIGIGGAGGNALLLVVKRFHQAAGSARGIDVLVIEQQARYGMLSEFPVVVEGCLEIDIAVHGLLPVIVEFAAAGVGADDVPVTVGIIHIAVPQTGFRVLAAGERESVVQLLVLVITGIVHVKGQERACGKSLAPVEEAQILGKTDIGIQLVTQLFPVTALGKVGQRVAQVACGGKARDGAVGHDQGHIDRVDLEGRVE